jgi:amidase
VFEPDDLDDLSVAEWSDALAAGARTSVGLVERSLARIDALNHRFNAIRCVVDDALDQAAESDAVRRQGRVRGALEGIPVVVKDNIDIAGVPTTGGSVALEHSVPERDAALVARLRQAGAVIVAKANLTEMANFLSEGMPSGYSSLGGQVLNPYDTSVTPGGSSSGSATAVALGLVPLAVGTETDGSIINPSQCQSLVGMKPTLGLVSRTGVLPIAPSQDTAGPMARSVADAALLLGALAGADPGDPATTRAEGPAGELAAGLDPRALEGAHLGVVREFADGPEHDGQPSYAAALEALAATGAELVDVTVPKTERDDELAVLHHEFAPAVDRYLAALGPDAPIRTLAELGEWNAAHGDAALKFGQIHLDAAVAIDHEATATDYREARQRDVLTVLAILEEALGDHLEALVTPGFSFCGLAARSGWPSIVVPAGYTATNRRPVGLMLIARPWCDARLLSLAQGVQSAHPVRRPPWAINPAEFRRFGLG